MRAPKSAANLIVAYTDGACSPNPGPGGWAAVVVVDGREYELCGHEPHTTNQRMELMGAIQALRWLKTTTRVAIYSDSAYVVNCFRDRWYVRWQKNGWKNSQGKPVENRDLWETLTALAEQHEVIWHKVAGHAGVPLNERADRLATEAIRRMLASVAPPAR